MRPEQAAAIARSLYQHNIEVRIKADKSPVTEADVPVNWRFGKSSRRVFQARLLWRGNRFHREDAEYLCWSIP